MENTSLSTFSNLTTLNNTGSVLLGILAFFAIGSGLLFSFVFLSHYLRNKMEQKFNITISETKWLINEERVPIGIHLLVFTISALIFVLPVLIGIGILLIMMLASRLSNGASILVFSGTTVVISAIYYFYIKKNPGVLDVKLNKKEMFNRRNPASRKAEYQIFHSSYKNRY